MIHPGTPEPTIQIEPGELQVEFPFSEVYLDGMMGSGQQINKSLRETAQETTQTTQEKILALLRDDPEPTHKMLATEIGITPDGVRYHLDSLRKASRIRPVGPTKKGYWNYQWQ